MTLDPLNNINKVTYDPKLNQFQINDDIYELDIDLKDDQAPFVMFTKQPSDNCSLINCLTATVGRTCCY